MNEEKATKILKDTYGYMDFVKFGEEVLLDGGFTIEQLEAIIWWAKSKV